jgi:hypothetical protein
VPGFPVALTAKTYGYWLRCPGLIPRPESANQPQIVAGQSSSGADRDVLGASVSLNKPVTFAEWGLPVANP